ncbi:hypothetical protein U9M48_005081 [Paspalum notatum var. saurae]|uniref:Peptidase S8/S53 domain-containing protein n=1 Tax=Paspalum notatum var. saurae TaxID=547442 RepID=A0AAQ3SI69_PASNO
MDPPSADVQRHLRPPHALRSQYAAPTFGISSYRSTSAPCCSPSDAATARRHHCHLPADLDELREHQHDISISRVNVGAIRFWGSRRRGGDGCQAAAQGIEQSHVVSTFERNKGHQLIFRVHLARVNINALQGVSFFDSVVVLIEHVSRMGPSKISWGVLKPDILAPGLNIVTTSATTGTGGGSPDSSWSSWFKVMSGTSMAAAHITGVVALLKAAHADRSPAAIKSAILTMVDPLDNGGEPILDEQHDNATSFAMIGHVNASRATDLGLVYDLDVRDYTSNICGIRGEKALKNITLDLDQLRGGWEHPRNVAQLSYHNGATQGYAAHDYLVFSKHMEKKTFNMMLMMAHIDSVFNKQKEKDAANARLRLTATIDVIRWLTFQACPFRGQDETPHSLNRSDFLEMVKLLAYYNNEVIEVVLENASGNAKYTSHEVQQEILSIIGRKVQEHFFDLIHVTDTPALTLKDSTCVVLADNNLSVQDVKGQGYDRASNMRGEWNGLKALILTECSYAYYIHCMAHQLQVVLVAA